MYGPAHTPTTPVDVFTQYGPHDAPGWPDGARERYLAACLGVLDAVAPGSAESVVHAEVLAPPDLERIFGLRGGSIFRGEQDLAQLLFMRPAPDLTRYATPVAGLYLCGADAPRRRCDGRLRTQRGDARLADRRRARVTRRLRRRS